MKLLYFISLILFFSCNQTSSSIEKEHYPIGDNKVDSAKHLDKSIAITNTKSISLRGEIESNWNKQKYDSKEILKLLSSYKEIVQKLGYENKHNKSVENFNRKFFRGKGFRTIASKSLFAKPKNKSLVFLLYEYQDADLSLELFDRLVNDKNNEGYFKSGGLIIYAKKHLLYIAGSCSIDVDEWDMLIMKLNINFPKLICYCGTGCEIEL